MKLTRLCRSVDFGDRHTDQRIAAAKMVIEKRKWRPKGEAVEPERDLRQVDRHRIEIHTINAPLEHMSLQEIHIREPRRVNRDALVFHLLENGFARVLQMRCNRIPRKGVQKIENLVGD